MNLFYILNDAAGAAADSTVTTGADAAAQTPGTFGTWTYLILMVVFFALIYFMMIRPEKKRNNELKKMRDSLTQGDQVTTNGGIVGTVVNVKDDEVTLESGIDGTKILIKKWAISSIDTIKD